MNAFNNVIQDLSKVYLYYTLDEKEMYSILYYYFNENFDFDYFISTKCGVTFKIVCYLLGLSYFGISKKLLPNSGVVAIFSENRELPNHMFVFNDDKIYQSYAMKYTLRIDDMKKEELNNLLIEFQKKPSKEIWEKLTHINNFQDGDYKVITYKYQKEKKSDIKKKALELIEKTLKCLDGKKDKRYLLEYFTCLLPDNREQFLLELKEKIEKILY